MYDFLQTFINKNDKIVNLIKLTYIYYYQNDRPQLQRFIVHSIQKYINVSTSLCTCQLLIMFN